MQIDSCDFKPKSKRLIWADHLKALGIVLVVVGHLELPSYLDAWVYSFHMPMFFILTGILLPGNLGDLQLKVFFRSKLRNLFIYYFVFSGLGILYSCIYSQVHPDPAPLLPEIYNRLCSVIYGSGSVDVRFNLFPITLWYFPAIIMALIITYCITRLLPKLELIAVFGTFVLGMYLCDTTLPWEIESGICAVPFIYIGRYVARFQQISQSNIWTRCFLSVVFVISGIILQSFNLRIDFRCSQFGNIFLFYSSCICTILGLFFLVSGIPFSGLTKRLAEASIIIFPTHVLFIMGLDAVCRRLGYGYMIHEQLYGFIKAFIAISIVAGLYPLISKFSSKVPQDSRGTRSYT